MIDSPNLCGSTVFHYIPPTKNGRFLIALRQKGVYKKPEVPKYDPEFFLCDEALWDKMVANVEPWVCPRCKAGPFCSLRQLKIHWLNKSCAGDKLHTGKYAHYTT